MSDFKRGAETLRRMADTYASLAEQSRQAGREAEAASYLRVWEEMLTAAQEVETKYAKEYAEPALAHPFDDRELTVEELKRQERPVSMTADDDYLNETPFGQKLMDGDDPGDAEEM